MACGFDMEPKGMEFGSNTCISGKTRFPNTSKMHFNSRNTH